MENSGDNLVDSSFDWALKSVNNADLGKTMLGMSGQQQNLIGNPTPAPTPSTTAATTASIISISRSLPITDVSIAIKHRLLVLETEEEWIDKLKHLVEEHGLGVVES